MTAQGMIRSYQNTYSALFRLLDVVLILGLLALCLWAYSQPMTSVYVSTGLLAAVAYLLMAESFGVYRSWRGTSALRILSVAGTVWVLVCVGLMALAFFAKVTADYSRVVMGGWMLSSLLLLMLWRLGFGRFLGYLRAKGVNTRRAAIVGVNECALAMREQLESIPELGYEFGGFFDDRSSNRVLEEYPDIHLEGRINELITRTRNGEFEVIFLALPLKAQGRIDEILQHCGDTTASVHLIPDFFTYNLIHARLSEVGNMQTISVYDTPIFGFNDVLKRLFDVTFSLCVLSVIALPMLIIAAAVKYTSPGPVLFKQYRYGLDGRKIQVWKFRSMSVMENSDTVVQARKGDARITRVGALIRKTSLDELPQFINVLQGRMSVVGPRPHAVAHNEEYRKLIPYYMLRHKVKPGITGWAQINGYRGETDTLDKMSGRVDYDLEYIRNWSLWMDVKIVFLTFFKGFTGSHVH
ncbi:MULTISPECIES: undecaprenyl-phosphate glucose phosphotransferase [unclassified Oceanobacter]|uniref:undecaprenyl-phosphate glucose phosphotransferase n=1 Tax=unclassified Oceanobacter TaxID=2620260 RepID=UPI002733F9AD|nr:MULTISPECIES: undecaprenyl-phosphate glucose phosphotransferase [unclassified Oceanobacter]MDP2548173.1 undecaprenyl-phosphate glucose phosphotransferase [Oceanobacter sp. 4_MG-2023]MDP2608094.1 undecaprenyl-phosphate glucose phosphotransferase [Oceanobacter sp. 1_MG-2023]MDP2611244.1 undecaprenyl-phosphate glucose phosphotransferase [Oceanobacter sp. 2_MG-2023]